MSFRRVPHLLTSGFGLSGLLTESSLLLAAALKETLKGVGGWELGADGLVLLGSESRFEIAADTSTAGVVGERDQSTVLVGIEALGVGKTADALLEGLEVLLHEGGGLSDANWSLDSTTVLVGSAVMAIS